RDPLLLHRRPVPAWRAVRLLDAQRADLGEEHGESLVAGGDAAPRQPVSLIPDRYGSTTHPADARSSLPAAAASAGDTPGSSGCPAPAGCLPWPACAAR